MKRKIVFLISFFIISLCINFRNVSASGTDAFQFYYSCYSGGTVLSSGSGNSSVGNIYTDGMNLIYKCPSGWTNVNFSVQFNLSGVGVMRSGSDITLKWVSTHGSYNSSILSIDNNTEGLANPSSGGINLVSGTVGSGNRYNFAIFGNGAANNQVLQGLRFGTDDDKSLLSQYLAGQKNFDEVSSALQSGMNSIINNQNQNQQQTNEKLDEINDNLTNSDVSGAQTDINNFFNGFTDNTHGLTAIVTAPLNLIKSITSSTCSPIGFEAPFVDQQITLPCMKEIYEQHFGSFLTLYQTITFGLVAYWVSVNILATVRGFKDPDSDKIEVLDL
mgnify:CR=1 FL=1